MAASNKNFTLCWDCKNATGGCRWSDQLHPVEGWTATQTRNKCGGDSYIVHNCPEFIRDAMNYGLKRYREDDPLCKAIIDGLTKNG